MRWDFPVVAFILVDDNNNMMIIIRMIICDSLFSVMASCLRESKTWSHEVGALQRDGFIMLIFKPFSCLLVSQQPRLKHHLLQHLL